MKYIIKNEIAGSFRSIDEVGNWFREKGFAYKFIGSYDNGYSYSRDIFTNDFNTFKRNFDKTFRIIEKKGANKPYITSLIGESYFTVKSDGNGNVVFFFYIAKNDKHKSIIFNS